MIRKKKKKLSRSPAPGYFYESGGKGLKLNEINYKSCEDQFSNKISEKKRRKK